MAMDLITSPTSVSLVAPASSLTRNRTPDSDPDTPPPPTQIYPKWVHQKHHHAPVEPEVVVTYKECLKNHAASIGGHALDGCCEFMPGPTCNPSDPTSLKCAACGCHRNFHRRDPDDPTPLHHHPPAARGPHSPSSASRLLLSLAHEETNPTPVTGNGVGGQNGNFTTMSSSSNSRKRFRTKFSQEQKDKMHEFSEKIGWKLKRGEEKLIEEFCKQVGVGRSVFKVWMHNNKHSSSSSIRKDKLSLDAPNYIININNNANNTTNNDTNGVAHHDFYSNGVVLQEQE